MELTVDLSQYEKSINRIRKRKPEVFSRMMGGFLQESAAKIKRESIMIAKKEAKGVSSGYGSYFSSFHISNIMIDESSGTADRWIKIYNTSKHSVVVEYGGIWDKSPPPSKALIKWVQVKLGIKDMDEVERVAEAIAWSYLQKGKSRKRGQVYFNKTNPEPGRVLVMNRASQKSLPAIERIFGRHVERALKLL